MGSATHFDFCEVAEENMNPRKSDEPLLADYALKSKKNEDYH